MLPLHTDNLMAVAMVITVDSLRDVIEQLLIVDCRTSYASPYHPLLFVPSASPLSPPSLPFPSSLPLPSSSV